MPRLNRRSFLAAAGAGIVVADGDMALAGSPKRIAAAGLKTSQRDRPIGLEDHRPTLSWQVRGERRGLSQGAYRILVGSAPERLKPGAADLWDSGKVMSDRTLAIPYGGPPLESRQRCYWSVTLWDEAGHRSAPSETTWWEMGLLERSAWRGPWLAAEDKTSRDERLAGMTWVAAPQPQPGETGKFRLAFTATGDATATLTIVARGDMSGVSIDGRPLTIAPHNPNAFGFAAASVLTFPVTAGAHVLAAEVLLKRNFNDPNSRPALAAQLQLTASGGTVLRITEGWRAAVSPTGDWRGLQAADDGWTLADRLDPQPSIPWPPKPATQFRRTFHASRPVRQARLYAAALGAYAFSLNGQKVGDDLLAGENVKFARRILYRVHDVTGLIQTGENVLGALVGDGWYGSYQAPAGRFAYGPAPRRFLSQLELTYDDGSRDVIATDEAWRMTSSPILASEIYDGEIYDARLNQPGWDRPGFDDAAWTPVWTAPEPPGALVAQVTPPIRALQTLSPVAVTQPAPGRYVFDFGQNMAGWVRLATSGPRGARVELRFAERLGSDGRVDQSNLRAARASDIYILNGDPEGEVFEPHFTYHGFRYVEFSGAVTPPDAKTLTAVVIHTDLEETGRFRIDNAVVQQLWNNALWSQRSNFVGIPTDCPQRDERLGWAGDAEIFWDTASYNMDVGAFTRRFMADLRDDQQPSGAFPIFAPGAGAGPSGPPKATPGWSDAGVVLPWTAYRNSGDPQVILENWEAMSRYLAGILADNPDFLWRNARGVDFGDWLALDAKAPGDPTTPKDLVASAMLARSVSMMADMADATSKTQEAAAYRSTLAKIKTAFNAAYVRPDGSVGNSSQTGYILTLAMDLPDPTLRGPVGAKLVEAIHSRGTLLTTGFLGTPFSLDALAAVGDSRLCYDLLLRTAFPSWGYMVAKGATTIWERWNGDTGDVAMNSFNHYALGAVCGFLYRRVAGIEAAEAGFGRIRVRPVLDPRIERWGADYDSVRGRISTNWRRSHDALELDLVVPANSRCEVHLPLMGRGRLTEGGRAAPRPGEIDVVERDAKRIVIETGAGRYRLRMA